MGLRFKTISARDLVNLLAKAERLGYRETDVADDEGTVHPVQGAHERVRSRLDALGTPTVLGERIGQAYSDSAASPQPSIVEESRETKTSEDNPSPGTEACLGEWTPSYHQCACDAPWACSSGEARYVQH